MVEIMNVPDPPGEKRRPKRRVFISSHLAFFQFAGSLHEDELDENRTDRRSYIVLSALLTQSGEMKNTGDRPC